MRLALGVPLHAAMSLAVLASLGACSSNPSSSGAPDRNSAWIVGDQNGCAQSQIVALTIRSVDGNSTVSGKAAFLEGDANPCTYPAAVNVPAGHHTIGVSYTAGYDVMVGAFSLNAEAGRTYDVSAHPVGTSYWFEAKPRIE